MSQVGDNLLGLTLDDGAAFFVKESAQSESGATITNVLLETFKFIGSEARNEFLMPQMTQLDWAMKAFENHVPDCELLFDQAMNNPSPVSAIGFFDELIKMAAGSSAAPCLRVIPGTSVLQNAYKSADSISDSLHGTYDYHGYVKQTGPVRVLPRAITPAQLQGVAIALNPQWQTLLSAVDLETFQQLSKLLKTWRQANLGAIGDNMRAQDAMSVLRTLSIYEEQPDWANHEVHVDQETGVIRVDDEIGDRQSLQHSFPDGDLGATAYHGGTRQLWEWALAHNAAMTERPEYNDVEWLDQMPDGDSFLVRDLDGRAHEVTREDLERRCFVWLGTNARTGVITPRNPHNRLFRLAFNDVIEYCVVEELGQGARNLHNQMQSAAWHMWLAHHGGLPNLGGSGVRTGEIILRLRNDALRNSALVPGVRRRIADLRDQLLHINHQAVQEALATLMGVETAPDARALNRYIEQADQRFAEFSAHLPQPHDLGNSTVIATAMHEGYTVIGSGRYAPTDNSVVALVPVLGRGVAPVELVADGEHRLRAERALNVAVVLEEPPATVYSPVKTMIATAMLQRLLDYMNGLNCPPGYNFDIYDPRNPYGTGQQRPCPHALLNRQLDRYEQALVHEIDNATVERMPDILAAVQKLVDARYFLNHIEEVIDSIMEREDWIYMLQSLVISLLVRDDAQITDSLNRPIVSVDSGVVPLRAAEFLFGRVMQRIRARPAYGRVVAQAMRLGIAAPVAVTQAANLARVIRAEVLFDRAVKGLDLLSTLLDGSNPLVSNVHVGNIQHLIDVDLANEVLSALKLVFDRDYLGLIDKVEFEAPWDCAEWTTQFAAFAFTVDHSPILYQAVDVATEIAVDSGMASVATALSRVGFDWTEIAPANLRVRGIDQATANIGQPMPMACPGSRGDGYYNDAPIAHQGLKVTTILPSYDIEAYNLVKAYLTMNTSRTYFAQPVGTDISDVYTMRLPVPHRNTDYTRVLSLILNDTTGQLLIYLSTHGIQFEKTPALANVAMILPYVANYLQKTAITRDYPVPQCLQIDQAKSLASTSGVTICPAESNRPDILSPTNGLAITVSERRSISTALPWVGS